RRADVDVVTLGVFGLSVTGSHGIEVRSDRLLSEMADETWDMVVLPGGLPGAHHLRDSADVQSLLKRQHEAGRGLAAICAAPIALGAAGVLDGKRATSYPGFDAELHGATYDDESRVVEDGTIVTSRGPGTAMEFALTLVARLADTETADKLRQGMLVAT
ncbi:MAG: DJ-1 family glyoxalase III, partial [Planctomycetota bacterium]